jgi:hypothetical protein
MRAIAQVFGKVLTLARVDKPLKEEAVGGCIGAMGKVRGCCCSCLAFADPADANGMG